ncbi:M23 family metallopeptidase [Paenibacillus sp. y28]|uniref:M23 family metallopeptidase n=1 Tax=Paenibacillus sp. y28 TaxID=3129110 RepID=UPI00301AB44D
MNESNKEIQNQELKNKENAPKQANGAPAVESSGWRKLLAKKWVFPATYMAAAAIILTLMWVYQQSGSLSLSEGDLGLKVDKPGQTVTDSVSGPDNALAVAAPAETMQWPVADQTSVKVVLPYYDSNASAEARQAAMIQFGDSFIPNVGITLARGDGQSFDVLAALSGTVSLVEKHSVVGNQVEITHPNGLITVYQSLADVQVQTGAQIKKGDVIAKAGRNELQKALPAHVQFEVRQAQDGTPLNPEQLLAGVAGTNTAAN